MQRRIRGFYIAVNGDPCPWHMLSTRAFNFVLSAFAIRLQLAANPHASAHTSSPKSIVSTGCEDTYPTLRAYGQLA